MRTRFKDVCFLGLILAICSTCSVSGQDSAAQTGSATAQPQTDPLAELSPENRALFDTLRRAAQQNDNATTLETGRKLLPALKPDTPLSNFTTQLTAGSAVETGNTAFALTILKPLADAHPDDWRAASLLARAYAESGGKALRDQQIVHVIALHKTAADPNFTKLHVFPIQKVKLHAGYAVFLYPFEPLKPHNTYLVALIYTNEGKTDYRLEVGSEELTRPSSSRNIQGSGASPSTPIERTRRMKTGLSRKRCTGSSTASSTTTQCGIRW